MKWRSFIIGHVSAWASCLLLVIGVVVYKVRTCPYELFGGGQHATSPCGRYEGVAMNMRMRTVLGLAREYYQLSVTDRVTGMEICRYEFPMGEHPVEFRGGVGKLIHWDPASTQVRFGQRDNTVWSYTLPRSEAEKKTPPQ